MGESRIGKQPVLIPKGITVKVADDLITVTNGKDTLKQAFDTVKVAVEADKVIVTMMDDRQASKERHGLYRSLISNMVEGLSKGYMRRLEIHGIGFKVELNGNEVKLTVGFSHPVVFAAPQGIELTVPNATTVEVRGVDKQLVGETAARLRRIRPPEPYKGKGIRYAGEKVRRKVGKSAGA